MESKPLFSHKMPEYQARITSFMQQMLPSANEHPAYLHEALQYAALGGGKRIRPLLIYATGEVLNIPPEKLDPAACAMELVHTYSLVHDDLPAMDDDDLRRGRPTVHKAFDEATAILVGDGLLTLSFEILANAQVDASLRAAWVSTLAKAAGTSGMIAGQSIDLQSEHKSLDLEALQVMHALKTGALISASVEMACQAKPDITDDQTNALLAFARGIGLAFQIRDDIIDVESTTEMLGKTQGADVEKGKSTYVSLLGLDEAKRRSEEVFSEACHYLDKINSDTEPLRYLAELIVNRQS